MTARRSRLARQRGLSLIEIMIGCVIGVIGILVMFQTVTIGSRHAQSTSIGGDADVAGTLALFNIERDLRLGGFGFGSAPATTLGCTVNATDTGSARVFTFPFTPIVINSGAGGAPDSIDVLYGNSAFATLGQRVISSTGTSNFLRRREGFKEGDLVVLAGTSGGVTNCYLHEITGTANLDGFTVDHVPAASYTSAYTGATVTANFNPTVAYPLVSGATLYSLGNEPRRNRWALGAGGRLQRTDAIFNRPAFDVADGILNLKAEYGVDTNANGSIEPNEWTFTAPAAWDTVLGVRIAVLVRVGAFERSPDAGASDVTAAVTPTNPSWGNGDANHQFLMTNVDGSADTDPTAPSTISNNWRYYRYRVYEKTVPLRNVIW